MTSNPLPYIPASAPKQFLIQVSGSEQEVDVDSVKELMSLYSYKCKWGDIIVCKGSFVNVKNDLSPVRWKSLYVYDGYDLHAIQKLHNRYVIPNAVKTLELSPFCSFSHWSSMFHQLGVVCDLFRYRNELIENVQFSEIRELISEKVLHTFVMIKSERYYLVWDQLIDDDQLFIERFREWLTKTEEICGNIRPQHLHVEESIQHTLFLHVLVGRE